MKEASLKGLATYCMIPIIRHVKEKSIEAVKRSIREPESKED